ncbi:hypothetical protein I7107_000037 [Vibrio parahaemolyticus]|uniref:hypothetical protein n=1 Tax=Vibrio TaxID=662 RepID=UPI0009A29A7D|nr:MULTISPECIES: hypothetical protein [Vibrio]EGQ8196113.1 hypothetical protein [Vibrio parahaemolyticus]EJE4691732.1 hypothetical protein [Vibrio parahaemolyticus]MDF5699724.1 hypothetical protein [Vibrio parahaemolyticus]NMU36473.1 hypothetical protein [Vibrio parahaemolyticus]HBC3388377.1 hypothetical protein [Vibrio parahaemolyticus]
MTRNEKKLRAALEELKQGGAKINPSAVEKKAGVSNGSLSYYTELYHEVLKLKADKSEKKTAREIRTETLKSNKNKALKAKREAQTELSELKKQVKVERMEHADAIANLTWALHKAQHKRVMEDINTAIGIKKLGKE